MSIQAKVVMGSSALYFADKTFDAIRDRFFVEMLGDTSWLVWAILASCFTITSGGVYAASHYCLRWARRSNPSCDIKDTKQ